MTNSTNSNSIPVERYLEIRSAYGAAFDATGDNLVFLSTITGMPQVWALEGTQPWPRQVSFFRDRVMSAHPSPVNDHLCINADEGGTENAQLYLTNLLGVEVEDLSRDPMHIYSFGSWAPDGKTFAYASNRRDGRHFDVYLYDLENHQHQPVHVSDYTNYAGQFSPDGKYLLLSRHYSNVNNDLLLVDLGTRETVLLTPHDGDAFYTSPRFADDGRSVYLLTSVNSEFRRVARIDLATHNLTFLTEDKWDAETLTLSKDSRYLTYSRNEDGTSRLYVWHRTEHEAADAAGWTPVLGLPQLPNGVIAEMSFHPDGQSLALTLSAPRFGVEVWLLSLANQTLQRATYAAISGVPQETFQEPELIHYESFDGLAVPAYYYRPHSPGPYSVVVYVHGGPESQSRNSFNSILQYLVNQGFAVLVPNVRGSSGYGLTYLHLDDVRKRMDSVADLAKSVDWLIAHGNAKANSIAVMGGSYGGFMVLAAVTHYPELWAAGVDIVGIANLRTFMSNTSAYRRHLRESEYGTIEADGDFFDEISPIHHVDKIQAPMIILHGANDPRVPVGEAEQMTAALQARNHPVEYLRFEDEGHGVVKLANRIQAYGAIAAFLSRHL